jgi:hypothetical protein
MVRGATIKPGPGVDPNSNLLKSLTVNGQSTVRMEIMINELRLVDGQSTLVAATVVSATDKIDGQSNVSLAGTSTFAGKIDGASTLRHAGGVRSVEFAGKIDGRSNVFLRGVHTVLFKDKIDGNCEVERRDASLIRGTLLAGDSTLYCPAHTDVYFDEISWGGKIIRNQAVSADQDPFERTVVHRSQSVEEFLASGDSFPFHATLEDAGPGKVTITPFVKASGCGCSASLTLPKDLVAGVVGTPESHFCCGKTRRVGEVMFRRDVQALLRGIFDQLIARASAEGAGRVTSADCLECCDICAKNPNGQACKFYCKRYCPNNNCP